MELWVPVWASLFTNTDSTLQSLINWIRSITIPIHQRRCRKDPANFHPTSLLSEVSECILGTSMGKTQVTYNARYNLGRGTNCKEGHLAFDHCFTLPDLGEKYINPHLIYWSYLRQPLGMILRARLWENLAASSIDLCLLLMIT